MREIWFTSVTGRLGLIVLDLGQDRAGEVNVLTTDRAGPSGTIGKLSKLVPAGSR